MKLAALFSGGKDSTYAIYLARKLSHSVDVLLTLHPYSNESHSTSSSKHKIHFFTS